MNENIKIIYKQHCSMYDKHPPCDPPCALVQATITGYEHNPIVSSWFNPHFIDLFFIEMQDLPTSLINRIKADFAPKVWGVDLHG